MRTLTNRMAGGVALIGLLALVPAAGLMAFGVLVSAINLPREAARVSLTATPLSGMPKLLLASGSPQMPAPSAVVCANTATPIPASALNGRDGLAIFNLGAATVFIGGSGVSTSTGFPVPSNTGISVALGYNKNVVTNVGGFAGPGIIVYCITAAGQTSPADTRVMEVVQ